MISLKNPRRFMLIILFLGIFTATSLFYGTKPGNAATGTAPDSGMRLTVSAVGNVNVAPDQARISLAVVSFDKDLNRAQSMNNLSTDKVFTALLNKGIPKDCIQTLSYNIWPEYNYTKENTNPEIIGYRVRNEITVIVNNLPNLGSVLDAAVKAGANNVNYIKFEKSEISQDENQALAEAVIRAKSKAQAIAKAADLKLGQIITMHEGGVYSYPPEPPVVYMKDEAMDIRSSSAVPVNPGDIKVTATITIVYELNKL